MLSHVPSRDALSLCGFLHLSCFELHPSSCTFLICLILGIIFSRFGLIQKVGKPCTAIAFNLHQSNEVLVALSDYSLRCYNAGKFFILQSSL